jgi:hypothetical protein
MKRLKGKIFSLVALFALIAAFAFTSGPKLFEHRYGVFGTDGSGNYIVTSIPANWEAGEQYLCNEDLEIPCVVGSDDETGTNSEIPASGATREGTSNGAFVIVP